MRSGGIIRIDFTAFGRLEWAWHNETMHRMSGSNITFKLGRKRMPVIGDFNR